MSGMTEVNKIAAEAVSGGDEAIAELIATGLGLIHVLQVYTSSMVCFCLYLCVSCAFAYLSFNRWPSQYGTGLYA